MVTNLYIVRHCEAEGNVNETFQGHSDGDITPKGALQLEKLAERFKDIPVDVVYSSPLQRAFKTAQAVARFHDVPVIADRDLMEINGGKMEGCKWNELDKLFPYEYSFWKNDFVNFQAPDGESIRGVYQRMSQAAIKHVSENKGKSIVIASHGGAVRTLLCYLLGYPPERIDEAPWVDNTSVSLFRFDDNMKPEAVFVNDYSHIADDPETAPHQMWWRNQK